MSKRIQAITMPKWGIEMQEGTLNTWHVAVGSTLKKGDPLLDVETEKIVNSVESPAEGVLRRVLVETGDTRPVGALLGVLTDTEVSDVEVDAFITNFKAADASFESADEAPAVAPAVVTAASDDLRVSPIAKRVAEALGIDIGLVRGTGRNGRISKDDVEAYARDNGLMTDNSATPVREDMTSMRLTIARRLLESKQSIPHYRVGIEVDATAMERLRGEFAKSNTKVSINDILLRATALALKQNERLNSHFVDKALLKFTPVDLCIAVATPGGLMTPILRAVDSKTITTIATESRALAAKARDGKLAKDDVEGGTFTVSNLGMFGIDYFDAIINPPQVAILAVGAAKPRAIVRDGKLIAASTIQLQLSCDHRVIDGAVGAKFLADLSHLLEGGDFS
ncbi:MAG: 2-oxo acid dehydrogenase subunit E2 [Gammaproteobacteria bacterium]|nr:2-oxo acid dehydrogenase subunit E2 [Gammaproteobacteria bacterium]